MKERNVIVDMYLKLLFIFLSYITTMLCLFAIVKFNPTERSVRKHVLILFTLYSLPSIVDITLFFVMVTSLIPPGDYGTGIELIVAIVNLIIFLPAHIVIGNNTYKKFKNFYPERKDLRAIKSLWKAVIIKTIFILPMVIWVVEV